MKAHVFGLALMVFGAACAKATAPCAAPTIVEVSYGWSYASDMFSLNFYRNDLGYTCTPGASIRNAFGVVIGQSYSCQKC